MSQILVRSSEVEVGQAPPSRRPLTPAADPRYAARLVLAEQRKAIDELRTAAQPQDARSARFTPSALTHAQLVHLGFRIVIQAALSAERDCYDLIEAGHRKAEALLDRARVDRARLVALAATPSGSSYPMPGCDGDPAPRYLVATQSQPAERPLLSSRPPMPPLRVPVPPPPRPTPEQGRAMRPRLASTDLSPAHLSSRADHEVDALLASTPQEHHDRWTFLHEDDGGTMRSMTRRVLRRPIRTSPSPTRVAR